MLCIGVFYLTSFLLIVFLKEPQSNHGNCVSDLAGYGFSVHSRTSSMNAFPISMPDGGIYYDFMER
jgi:hypothetical protein